MKSSEWNAPSPTVVRYGVPRHVEHSCDDYGQQGIPLSKCGTRLLAESLAYMVPSVRER